MRRAVVLAVAALALSAGPARAAVVPVQIQYQAFSPAQIDLLPGESVQWTNTSERTHTVTADDGSFASGELPGGTTYAQTFPAVASVPYHCTIHLGMTGRIDVRGVILDAVPPAAVPAGQSVRLTGRTADAASPVVIERDTGPGFARVASATPRPDGTWNVDVPAQATADYRATGPSGSSVVRRLLVTDRRITLTVTPRGVRATVTPADPRARVVLQVLLRERFGWWPTARATLDYLSRADFRVAHRPARVRVVLVDRDGWTALVTSAVVRLGPRR